MTERKVAMISSTTYDLPEHREQVRLACERAGFEPHEMMEHLTALDTDAVEKDKPRLIFFMHDDHPLTPRTLRPAPAPPNGTRLADRLGDGSRLGSLRCPPVLLCGHWRHGQECPHLAVVSADCTPGNAPPGGPPVAHPYSDTRTRRAYGRCPRGAAHPGRVARYDDAYRLFVDRLQNATF